MATDYFVSTDAPEVLVASLLEGQFDALPNGALSAFIGDQYVGLLKARYRGWAEDQFNTTLPLIAMFRVQKDDANATLDFVLAFVRRLLTETGCDVVWEADYGACFLARIGGRLLLQEQAPWLWTLEARATMPPHEVAPLPNP